MAKAKKFSGGGGAGNGLAQSGGINHTFGGGKGGTARSKKATHDPVEGSGRLNNGLHYNVRNPGGDDARVPQTGKIGSPPPIHPGGKGATKTVKVSVRKPQYGGGSR